jgi:hypothetical protein
VVGDSPRVQLRGLGGRKWGCKQPGDGGRWVLALSSFLVHVPAPVHKGVQVVVRACDRIASSFATACTVGHTVRGAERPQLRRRHRSQARHFGRGALLPRAAREGERSRLREQEASRWLTAVIRLDKQRVHVGCTSPLALAPPRAVAVPRHGAYCYIE